MICEIHKDKVNADSDWRNKQIHHGNDRERWIKGCGNCFYCDYVVAAVASLPAAVPPAPPAPSLPAPAAVTAGVLFAYAISISRQLQSPDACQTQCKP